MFSISIVILWETIILWLVMTGWNFDLSLKLLHDPKAWFLTEIAQFSTIIT